MIGYRSYELSSGKKLFSEEKRAKSDQKLLTFYHKNINLTNRFLINLKSNFQNFFHFVNQKLNNLWCLISKKVDGYFDRIKGKKEINKKGSVSLYWQSVGQREDLKK